jgi:hypothetical protein
VIVKHKGKGKVPILKYHTLKTYGGVEVYLHEFLTLALDLGEWLASRFRRIIPGKESHVPIE